MLFKVSARLTITRCFARCYLHLTDCRAAERTAGGVCEQALPRPGEDRQEPEERGTDPGQNRGLEGGHRRGDGIFRRPRGVHPILVSKTGLTIDFCSFICSTVSVRDVWNENISFSGRTSLGLECLKISIPNQAV